MCCWSWAVGSSKTSPLVRSLALTTHYVSSLAEVLHHYILLLHLTTWDLVLAVAVCCWCSRYCVDLHGVSVSYYTACTAAPTLHVVTSSEVRSHTILHHIDRECVYLVPWCVVLYLLDVLVLCCIYCMLSIHCVIHHQQCTVLLPYT